jgi:hypothetical protein
VNGLLSLVQIAECVANVIDSLAGLVRLDVEDEDLYQSKLRSSEYEYMRKDLTLVERSF